MNSQACQSERGVLVGQEALEAHGVLADFHLGLPKMKTRKNVKQLNWNIKAFTIQF